MVDFQYYTPTRVVFGKDTESRAGELVKQDGGTRVLVHYGSASAQKSGLLGRVTASLEDAGLAYVELGGVVANPRLSLVRQGVQLCKDEKIDYILAVGGGSVIDSAKAIGYGACLGSDVWDLFTGAAKAAATLPVGCVLTIAAAGSEMSNSSVITNEETKEKRGYNDDILGRARFAVMNPALTLTLPAYQTACGSADILMHTLERYFTPVKPTMGVTDAIAEALMRTIMENGRRLTRNPKDEDARAQMMWAGSLSHNGLTGCGNGAGDWACHQLGHEISGRWDLAHGASLTMVWGSWARYVYQNDLERFVQLALNVLDVEPEGTDEEIALAGIEEVEGFFWGIEMPTSFEEAGIKPDEKTIGEMARDFTRGGTRRVGGVMQLDAKDAEKIYRMALYNKE